MIDASEHTSLRTSRRAQTSSLMLALCLFGTSCEREKLPPDRLQTPGSAGVALLPAISTESVLHELMKPSLGDAAREGKVLQLSKDPAALAQHIEQVGEMLRSPEHQVKLSGLYLVNALGERAAPYTNQVTAIISESLKKLDEYVRLSSSIADPCLQRSRGSPAEPLVKAVFEPFHGRGWEQSMIVHAALHALRAMPDYDQLIKKVADSSPNFAFHDLCSDVTNGELWPLSQTIKLVRTSEP